ncbi:MAG: vancomycin resistance protein, partial [Clostridia bacterium]|nr:vancomycin resistance protein [Clostridia bacterium]
MANMVRKPKNRSEFRNKLGYVYYGTLRRLNWLCSRRRFARTQSEKPLCYSYFSHKTLLRRKLRNVDMWMQENKIVNLKLAVPKINGILTRPGETFS